MRVVLVNAPEISTIARCECATRFASEYIAFEMAAARHPPSTEQNDSIEKGRMRQADALENLHDNFSKLSSTTEALHSLAAENLVSHEFVLRLLVLTKEMERDVRSPLKQVRAVRRS